MSTLCCGLSLADLCLPSAVVCLCQLSDGAGQSDSSLSEGGVPDSGDTAIDPAEDDDDMGPGPLVTPVSSCRQSSPWLQGECQHWPGQQSELVSFRT